LAASLVANAPCAPGFQPWNRANPQLKFDSGGNAAEGATFANIGVTTEVGTMKKMVSAIVLSLAVTSLPALAQTNNAPGVSTPSAPNSGAGVSGYPGNKNGPAAKGTVGSSTSTNKNEGVQQQDASKIQGMPGNKSGPPAKQPSR